MQSVGITTAFHDTARLLVDDFDLAVHEDVFLVFFKQGVGLEQLAHGVNPLAFDAVFAEQGGLVVGFVCGGFLGFFYGCQRRGDVGHHKEVRIGPLGQAFHAAVRELNLVVFLLNGEVEFLVDHLHFPAVVLHVKVLGLLKQGLVPVFAEELDQGLVFGKAAVGAEQLEARVLGVARCKQLLGLVQGVLGNGFLRIEQVDHVGLQFVELVAVSIGRRAGNNQRRPGVVDQYGVDFVHNGEVVAALHQFLGEAGHVVPQVVESELVVGTEGDVCGVGLAAGVGVGLVFVDAVYREAVELVERAHPFGVSLGEVVVHGYQVHAKAGEGVEINGQGGHQGLAFSRGHFRNTAQMEDGTADQLYVVVHHVPFDGAAGGGPGVVPNGRIALDAQSVHPLGQFPVHVCGGYPEIACAEPACRFPDHRKSFGKDFCKLGFGLFVGFFVEGVYF